ncbi:ADP-heptose--LPS heptosyltransferase [Pseudodesulfovibrio sp. F-1]|uniref:ADP-heptose--LPS heptosyltransferase n=1 Tax=Pseudodesulfovibrio alkaliphilus TaxID=2661613 RepID=A0A7K1KQX1_9BACT|nr:glycosyltransferase family 9 protein [Pseudodesulfovibrio alkaliphilus]MUM78251.1 ADP-heptose--LPS heptosyltransferase [Pseudodesulfovibrio alkaliphilus]
MKHYLVIQLARFGDLIQTKRLVVTLAARPDSRVHLCLDRSLEPLARLVYPNATLHPVIAHGTGLDGSAAVRAMLVDNRRSFATLGSFDFERIYNLNFSGLNFRLAALFDPDKVEGYLWRDGQELISPWAAMAMRWSDQRRLSINLVDFWAAYCPDAMAPQLVNPSAAACGGGLGVVLAGRESRRSLPVDVLSRVVGTVARVRGAGRVVLLGGPCEQAAGQALLKELPPAVQAMTRNAAGQTGWNELVDIVDSLDLLLTPDTGTMHLAAHLGTPVLAFFLSSAWCFETGPYGEGHVVHQTTAHCLPCLETRPCNHGLQCLGPFADPGYPRFLATGNPAHAPDGLMVCRSQFDALGQTYAPIIGLDQDAEQRAGLRQFIFGHLTGDRDSIRPELSDLDTLLAQRLHRERDWITTVPMRTITE